MIFTRVTFLNEGEQAEEYKRKKAEEEKRQKEEEEKRQRHANVSLYNDNYNRMRASKNVAHREDKRRYDAAEKAADGLAKAQQNRYDAAKRLKDDSDSAVRKNKGIGKYLPGGKQSIEKANQSTKDYNKAIEDEKKASSNYNQKHDEYMNYDSDVAAAAILKDMRRHPDRWKKGPDGQMHRESSIFESVEFI